MALFGDIEGQYKKQDVEIIAIFPKDPQVPAISNMGSQISIISVLEISSRNGLHRSSLGRYSYYQNTTVAIKVIYIVLRGKKLSVFRLSMIQTRISEVWQ